MTSRERLMAAIRGGEVDRKPVLSWPEITPGSDAFIATQSSINNHQSAINEGVPTLIEVLNPFSLALYKGVNLNEILEDDPNTGETTLKNLAEEVRHTIDVGIAGGAEGFLYRLHGAHPDLCTPMQYGGHYLEVDRAILDSFEGLPIRAIFVVGGEGTYIDFVSDLPAELFGWDVRGIGVSLESVRSLRPTGALLAATPDADVIMTYPSDISPVLETQTLAHA